MGGGTPICYILNVLDKGYIGLIYSEVFFMKKKQLLTAAAVGAATVVAGMGAANVHADSVTVTKQHIGNETKVTTTTHHDGKSRSQISSDKAAIASQKKVVSSAKASMDSAQGVVNNDKTKVSSAQANVNSAKSKLDSAQSKVNEPSSLKNDMSKQSQRISSDKTAIANKQNDVKNDQAKVAQDEQNIKNNKLTPAEQQKVKRDEQNVTNAQAKVNQDQANIDKIKKGQVAGTTVSQSWEDNGIKLTDAEQAELDELNKIRASFDLPPVQVASNLQNYANQRNQRAETFLNEGKSLEDAHQPYSVPIKNKDDMGYTMKTIGECFSWNEGVYDMVYNDGSSNYAHREMLLDPNMKYVGIVIDPNTGVETVELGAPSIIDPGYYGLGNDVFENSKYTGPGAINPVNTALQNAESQLKNDQQTLQNAQNALKSDKNAGPILQLENDQKQLQQDQQDLNNLQNDLQNAQNQLDNDQKTLNSITPADIANAKKALADAQNDYNNAVQALNQAQAQENADQATLAKYQTAYQAALQKLDELEAALKADEPYDTTSVQWIKDQQPMTSAEISSRYVMRSTAKASYKSGDADVVYADTVTANKQATKKALPDTGDAQNSAASVAGILGLGLAGILSMFGLAERKKRN